MTRIPPLPLLLGLAGLIPFLWGAATALLPAPEAWSRDLLGDRFTGAALLQTYGVVILSFMSGVIWGFAARAEGALARLGYASSVLPSLWAFFFGLGAPVPSLLSLAVGFVALLALDARFARAGAAPGWWLSLRLLLTGIVTACLLASAVAA